VVVVSPPFAEIFEGVEVRGLGMYSDVVELSAPGVDWLLVVEGRPVKGVV